MCLMKDVWPVWPVWHMDGMTKGALQTRCSIILLKDILARPHDVRSTLVISHNT